MRKEVQKIVNKEKIDIKNSEPGLIHSQGAEVTGTFLIVLNAGAEVTDNLSFCSDSVRRSQTHRQSFLLF